MGPIVSLSCPALGVSADWLRMLAMTTSPKGRKFPQEHPSPSMGGGGLHSPSTELSPGDLQQKRHTQPILVHKTNRLKPPRRCEHGQTPLSCPHQCSSSGRAGPAGRDSQRLSARNIFTMSCGSHGKGLPTTEHQDPSELEKI